MNDDLVCHRNSTLCMNNGFEPMMEIAGNQCLIVCLTGVNLKGDDQIRPSKRLIFGERVLCWGGSQGPS